MRTRIRIGRLLLASLLTLAAPPVNAGLDAPHDAASSGIGCLNCHQMTSTYPKLLPPLDDTTINIDDSLANGVCRSCHNGTIAVYMMETHSSLTTGDPDHGQWTVECWVCHNEHMQEQDRYNGSTYGKYIRRSINLANIKDGDGNPILGKTGIKSVKFLGQTGPNSFADGDPATIDGICEVCHTQTTHFRNNNSLGGNEESHAGYTQMNCINCHHHDGGFRPGEKCLDCHSGSVNNRTAIGQQFNSNSHHIQGIPVTSAQCYQCHWEADPEGKITSYHSAFPGAAVDLVIYGAGARPGTYTPTTTAVAYTADGSRAQILSLNDHCLGCHRDQNNATQPFGDGKTPKQYAWDGSSVNARYSQAGTTPWGKYSGANVTPKNNRAKAYSAHGNAVNNQGGWDLNETWPNTRNGGTNVACFDCHNSHGSSAAGVTTRYASATVNGGILKDTSATKGGYAMSYTPQAGGTAEDKNLYNAGAGLCFDCHLNQSAGMTPWGYNSSFGAAEPIIGYWDSPNFASGDVGAQKRNPYKMMHVGGGHLGASSALATAPLSQINGLCTACHDPHGVSPTLLSNQQYGVPLLKGTWLSSPYREDVAPLANEAYMGLNNPGSIGYHIDQNTFGNDILGPAPGNIVEQDAQFAGLCLTCHPKNSLTKNGPNAWKSKDRIHESVKGWKTSDATIKHDYTCSKCHTPHNGSLPRLMITNCLNSRHKGRTAYNPSPLLNSGGWGSGDNGSGEGSGRIPGSYSGSGDCNDGCGGPAPGTHLVTCHETQTGSGTDQSWNVITAWSTMDLTAPTLIDEPSTGCNGTCAIQLNWWPVINPDGDAVQYNVQVDDAADFSSPNSTSGWISTTNWSGLLATANTWHWRVQTRDALHPTIVSGWQTPDSFSLSPVTPPPAPTLIDEQDAMCTGTCAVLLAWNPVSVPDGDPARYQVQVSTAADFSSIYYASAWLSGTSVSILLPTGNAWYWRAMTGDSVHTAITSGWSTADTFRMAAPPPAPTLIAQTNSLCAASCSVTLQWTTVAGPFGDPVEYFIEVDDAADFTTPVFNNSGNWTAGTSVPTSSLVTNTIYYWRVKDRDVVSPVFESMWSATGVFTFSTGEAPPQVILTAPANGANALSDLALQWSAVSPVTEYLVQYSTDSTFNSGVASSSWMTSTAWNPAPGPGTYYWRVQARDAASQATGPWSTSWSFIISDGCYGDSCCLYGCSTCPTLYSWDGTRYAFETDTFPTGFLGTKTATGWRKPNPYEYHLLESAPQLQEGSYVLKIVEERDETDYFDTLKLYTVDYPVNRDIYQELRTAGVYVEPAQMIHTVAKTLQKPLSITHVNTGEDVAAKLAFSDEDYLILNTDRNIDFNWQTLEIDLGDQSQVPQIKLIIDAEMVVPTTSAGMARKIELSPNGKITRLEVLDANGNWTLVPYSVKEIFSPKERSSAYIVGITNIFTTSTYKFRLSFLYKVYVDAIYFDTTQDLPVTVVELPLSTATLGYYGFSEKTEGEIFDYIYGNIVSRDTSYFSGKHTRYGNVAPLLTQTDDKFVIFAGGEEITVTFDADSSPPVGMARRYLVYANGYYKATGNNDITHTVEPLPFAAMSNFPYDPTVEHYPDDAEHLNYLETYNTREQ